MWEEVEGILWNCWAVERSWNFVLLPHPKTSAWCTNIDRCWGRTAFTALLMYSETVTKKVSQADMFGVSQQDTFSLSFHSLVIFVATNDFTSKSQVLKRIFSLSYNHKYFNLFTRFSCIFLAWKNSGQRCFIVMPL